MVLIKQQKLKFYMCNLAALLALFALTSCTNLDAEDKEEEEKDRFTFLADERNSNIGKTYDNPEVPISEEEVIPQKQGLDADNLKKFAEVSSEGQQGKIPARKVTSAFYEDFILLNSDEEIDVSFAFNSAPLIDVLPAFADILGFNFVADSNIKSVVTININSKMTYRELWNTFERVLYLAGATVKVEDSLLRIMLMNRLGQQPDIKIGNEILYYPVKNATAKEVLSQIQSFIGLDGTALELTTVNALLICDSPENNAKLRQILDVIDYNARTNWPRVVMPCNNILPTKIVDELQTILPVLGFSIKKVTDTTTQPGAIQMFGIDRLKLIVVSAATQEVIKEIQKWIDILDIADSLDQERVFVYKVTHGKAEHLAQALTVIYNTEGTAFNIDTSTGDEQTSTLTSSSSTSSSSTVTAGTAISSTETDLNSSIFETSVKIFSDGFLNRLVIRTTPRTYASIKALLERLDVVPAQVLIQALVVEVTLTETTQFGLELSAQNLGNSLYTTAGTNYGNVTSETTPEGFSIMLADPSNPDNTFGYIQALAGESSVKVISSPQVLVSSHSEARIQVGSQIPVITGGITDSSSSGSITQTYEYEDTGIILTLTPQITSNNLINLEVTQELSDAIANTTSSTIDSPELTVRSISTTMTIAEGKTMIMGGLIQEKMSDSLSTIPFIDEIPFLRRLLGNTEATISRTEILVLITGYIVHERSHIEDLIARYNEAIDSLNEFDKTIKENKNHNRIIKRLDNSEIWR